MPRSVRRFENLPYFVLGAAIWLTIAYMVIIALIQGAEYLWHHL